MQQKEILLFLIILNFWQFMLKKRTQNANNI